MRLDTGSGTPAGLTASNRDGRRSVEPCGRRSAARVWRGTVGKQGRLLRARTGELSDSVESASDPGLPSATVLPRDGSIPTGSARESRRLVGLGGRLAVRSIQQP